MFPPDPPWTTFKLTNVSGNRKQIRLELVTSLSAHVLTVIRKGRIVGAIERDVLLGSRAFRMRGLRGALPRQGQGPAHGRASHGPGVRDCHQVGPVARGPARPERHAGGRRPPGSADRPLVRAGVGPAGGERSRLLRALRARDARWDAAGRGGQPGFTPSL
jgi:hypothetical protein